MRHAQEPTYSFMILTFILIIVNTLLAYLSEKIVPAGAGGIAYIYIAVAFMILFTLWFGGYGAIAAYLGTLIAGVLTTATLMNNPVVAVIWAVSGLLQVLIPLTAVRMFDVDLTMAHMRDWTIIMLFAVLINNAVGAAWGVALLSFATSVNFTGAFLTWFIGNIIVTILIVPLALRLFTPKIKKSKLFVKQYWD